MGAGAIDKAPSKSYLGFYNRPDVVWLSPCPRGIFKPVGDYDNDYVFWVIKSLVYSLTSLSNGIIEGSVSHGLIVLVRESRALLDVYYWTYIDLSREGGEIKGSFSPMENLMPE
jgi:hypothetical protein